MVFLLLRVPHVDLYNSFSQLLRIWIWKKEEEHPVIENLLCFKAPTLLPFLLTDPISICVAVILVENDLQGFYSVIVIIMQHVRLLIYNSVQYLVQPCHSICNNNNSLFVVVLLLPIMLVNLITVVLSVE